MSTKIKIQITVTLRTDILPGETAHSTIEYMSKYPSEVQDMVMNSKDLVITFQEVEVAE